MDGDEVGIERTALARRRHEPEELVSSNIMTPLYRLPQVTGVVATDGNRVAVEVPIEHGSHMDPVARACEDYFYNFDPQVDVPLGAAEVLCSGLMSPALIDLVCLRRDDRSEICALVPRVFAELGRVFRSGPAVAFAR